ncbi:hypothetical protein [Sphingomonas sp. RS2018]
MILTLIERIRERLAQNAYVNEAAISHGVVTPVLNALGWDSADPQQLVPEYTTDRGRVDFALFGLGHRPAVFVEVKAVGRAVYGDKQLFEYAFHQGVPLCVLTDGREWSFYLPSGQGSYEDRRVYRLQLDDRDPEECERILVRYLARDRVRDQLAFEDAQRDYRDAAGQREAISILPRAWSEMLATPEELLVDAVADKAEAMCGYKPDAKSVLAFLRTLRAAGQRQSEPVAPPPESRVRNAVVAVDDTAPSDARPPARSMQEGITFIMLGKEHHCANAKLATVEVLRNLAIRDPSRIPALADAVRTPTLNRIAHTPAEINPGRPELANAAEFAPGWLVGLNISNRDKMRLIRAAAEIYELTLPEDLQIELPNG